MSDQSSLFPKAVYRQPYVPSINRSLDLVNENKTSVVAYWLWLRASDARVMGSSPGKSNEIFLENND